MLEAAIRERLKQKELLLMTHIVLGYRDFDESLRVVERMVEAGVDLMELQIPFSEPMADGPVILHANAAALKAGATVERCFEVAEGITKRFDIPFLYMTYYNILFRQGVAEFVARCSRIGIQACIVPDLPPDEGREYLEAMQAASLAPVHIFTPNTDDARMRYLDANSAGMIYCVARKGVTGRNTDFNEDMSDYLARCRAATDLPLAVGFGLKSAEDVAFLRGKADIAVVGSETIRVLEREGVDAVETFIRSLLVP
ncbi:MAG: tryptophan synthase subunit alpha [Gammaproteobacteria bacterium]|nr:MAG: tryptophan synthase subunit alpha [Gammaproteobacteria bacterium]